MQLERHALFWTASALLFVYLVQVLAPVLLPFVLGMTLAYFFNPLVDILARAGLPRWASAILLLAASTCLIVLALVFVVPILAQQAAGLIEAAPREIARFRVLIEDSAREYLGGRYPQAESTVRTALESFSSAMPSMLTGLAASVWNKGSAAFNFVSVLLVTPLVFFYALLDWPKMIAKLDSWLPRDNADQIRALALEIDSRVSAFIRGQGAVCLILALYYAAALSVAGLEYGLLVGSLTGLASFIPIFGWSLGAIAATVLAAIQFLGFAVGGGDRVRLPVWFQDGDAGGVAARYQPERQGEDALQGVLHRLVLGQRPGQPGQRSDEFLVPPGQHRGHLLNHCRDPSLAGQLLI